MNCDNTPMFDGDAEALFSVGRRFLAGNGVEKDEAKGRQMISEAAAMGHSMAIQFLASQSSKQEEESKPALKPVCAHNPAIECPCPKECPRHGKCCACVAHHREHGKLPACLRNQQ